jgi:hypothetical protein
VGEDKVHPHIYTLSPRKYWFFSRIMHKNILIDPGKDFSVIGDLKERINAS